MAYDTQYLLDWFEKLPFTEVAKIYPHSRILQLGGEAIEIELKHLSESWCRKSTQERDLIKEQMETKFWQDLPWEVQDELARRFTLPEDKVEVLVDQYKRPYFKTLNGRIYYSTKKEYNYSIKN